MAGLDCEGEKKPYLEPDFDGFVMHHLRTGEPKWLYLAQGGVLHLLCHFDLDAETERKGQPCEVTRIHKYDLGESKYRETIQMIVDRAPLDYNAPFSEALRAVMIEQRIPLRDMAVATGLGVVRVSDLRRGAVIPTEYEVLALAAFCGAPVEEWFALATEQAQPKGFDE